MAFTYTFPIGIQAARSQVVLPFGSGVMLPDAYEPSVWLSAGAGSATTLTKQSISSGSGGILAGQPGPNGSVYLLGELGSLYTVSSGMAVTVSDLTANGQGNTFVDMVLVSGVPYSLGFNGAVVNPSGVLNTQFAAPASNLLVASGRFVAFGPSGMGLSPLLTGLVNYVVLPAALSTVESAASISGSFIAAGGWAPATMGSGFLVMAPDPAVTQIIGLGSGFASVFSALSSSTNTYTFVSSLTSGLTAKPSNAAWTPNGTQILVTDPTAGSLKVINFSAGVMTIGQTLAMTGAADVAILDNATALIANGSAVVPLTGSTSGWTIQSSIAVSGAVGLAPLTPTTAVAIGAAGLSFLTLNANVWSVTNTLNVGFVPTQIAVNNFGNIFVAASGVMAAVSPVGSLLASGVFTGNPLGIWATAAQLVVNTGPSIQIVGDPNATGVWTTQNTYAPAVSSTSTMQFNRTLFVYGGSDTPLYNWWTPYAWKVVRNGAVGIYSFVTSAWTVAPLGLDTPAVMADTGSGSVIACTYGNHLYTVTTAGVSASLGTIGPYTGQTTGVSMGISAIMPSGATTYFASCMAGALVTEM